MNESINYFQKELLNNATPYYTDYNGFSDYNSTTPLLMHQLSFLQ